MIDEVRGLLDQYAQWVRDKSILRKVNDQYLEITNAYLDRYNDYTQIRVPERREPTSYDIDRRRLTKLRHRPCALEPSRRSETRVGGLS